MFVCWKMFVNNIIVTFNGKYEKIDILTQKKE